MGSQNDSYSTRKKADSRLLFPGRSNKYAVDLHILRRLTLHTQQLRRDFAAIPTLPWLLTRPRIPALNKDVDPSNLIDLALSFPLLWNFEVQVNRIAHRTLPYGWVTKLPDVPLPSRFPALVGTLALDINSSLRHITPMLLSPDGSLCVRRLKLTLV